MGKIKAGCKKVGEWCKEHWRIIITAVVVVAAVIVAFAVPVLAPILIAAGKAALWGAAVGGIVGGITSARSGGSFWKGFEEGAFTGAVMGALGAFAGAAVGLAGSATGRFLANLGSNSCRILGFMETTFKISGGITAVMGGFDTLSLVSEIFLPGNPLSNLNGKLHSNALYNGFQQLAGFTAIFSGAAYHQLKKYPTTCFVAGTMILTTAGLVAIEKIKAGDKVIATDMIDFTTSEKRVVETYVHKAEKLIHLTIHNEEITTTSDHPFYVKEHGFTNAGDLRIGDEVITVAGGSHFVEKMRLEIVEEPETVYNFQVEDYHTYYVGESRVLVHNNGGCTGGTDVVEVEISKKKYPESAKHIEDAINNGQPDVLTIDRTGKKANRRASLKGIDKVPGKDLDEYPPAMFKEGGSGASVRPINRSDNRGAGSTFGHKLREFADGTKVKFKISDN